MDDFGEYLSNTYEWDIELNSSSITVYLDDVTVIDMLKLCSEVENYEIIGYSTSSFKLSLR